MSGKTEMTMQKDSIHTLKIFGMDTEKVRGLLEDIAEKYQDVSVRIQEDAGETYVTAFPCGSSAENNAAQLIAETGSIIGQEYVYGVDIGGLEYALVARLKEKGIKIATAESLTGGMVSESITRVPGASGVLECGVCSYSNRIKHEILGVSEETLEKYTEYSAQTACEMAQGVRSLSGADIGVATTGIAGPGGVNGKPAGTVYVNVRDAHFEIVRDICKYKLCADPDRDTVRRLSAQTALEMVLELCAKSAG